MRPARRPALSTRAETFLKTKRADLVDAAEDPVAEAHRLWKQRANQTFDEIRETLASMAPGRSRCMYCEDSAGTDIEHFWPKADYPDRAFSWPNYLWACSHCNSNLKRDRFPLDADGAPLLIDPSDPNDDPRLHLVYLPSTGSYQPKTKKGATSCDVFGLNDDSSPRQLPSGRRGTWVKLGLMLQDYARRVERGDHAKAEETKRFILDEPFQGVLVWLLEIARDERAASVLLEPSLLTTLSDHDVESWLRLD